MVDPENGGSRLRQVRYPDPYGTPECNNSWYLNRRPAGAGHYGQVIDSLVLYFCRHQN
jgi:hypothetical protein